MPQASEAAVPEEEIHKEGDIRWVLLPGGQQVPAELVNVGSGGGEMTALELQRDASDVRARHVLQPRDVGACVRSPELLCFAEGCADMVRMADTCKEAVLFNLELRFARDIIYSSVGEMLISINPYRWLPAVFSDDVRRRFVAHALAGGAAAKGAEAGSVEPHVWDVASEAHAAMRAAHAL